MKNMFVLLSLFIGLASGLTSIQSSYASTESKQQSLLKNYQHVIELADHKGQTFLSFMKEVVRPAMVDVVENGYVMVSPKDISDAYDSVDERVQKALERAGGLTAALKVARGLEGQNVYIESLPQEIAKIDRKVDRYKLANFLGLTSGGGVVIRLYENNYAYNVHYDKTEEKSGRSYGVGPTRLAYDASDKAYLTDIQEYFSDEETNSNLTEFYRTLLHSLLNTDPENYPQVAPFGQTVLSDFLSVYTAEQARNLMDNSVDIHWDAALLEVTLLASFHAGQETVKLYYQNPQTKVVSFTDQVFRQVPCEVPQKTKAASMVDYWQFSRRIDDPKNCRRSGINVTKREFRLLGQKITAYMEKNSPQTVIRLRKAMGLKSRTKNLYLALSKYLINESTAKELSESKVNRITETWVDFLSEVTKNAKKMTRQFEQEEE